MKNAINTYHFVGHLTTLEPLTVTLAKPLLKGHSMPRNNGLPYFPSSSIIGAIRHAGVKFTINHFANLTTPVQFDLNTIYAISQGYIVDNELSDQINKPSTNTPIDKDEQLREVNPLLSVFGRWGLAGKFGVGSAYASREDQVNTFSGGFRCDLFTRDEEMQTAISQDELERYFKMIANQSAASVDTNELKKQKTQLVKKLKNATEEEKTSIKAEIETLENQIKERKNDTGEARETIKRPIDSTEAIVANTQLKHRMTLKRGTLTELGATLYSLAQLSQNPQLGGKARHNWGHVHASWVVRIPQPDFTNKEIGKVGWNDDGFFVEGDILSKAMKEYMNDLNDGKFDFTRLL